VDADDFMQEMVDTAKSIAKELGKLEGMTEKEANNLYEIVGLGALKYFLLKVDPKKSMLFNPEESIDFHGNTGPFIQYTYARINSILRKNTVNIKVDLSIKISNKEKELIKLISEFPKLIQESANSYNPALVANYIFELVKEFNSYYQSTPILNAESKTIISFRVALSKKIAEIIKIGMSLLGIKVPERM
jgi:arginyl-tRNA synthetase